VKAFVTGATGFIGSRLVELLVGHGHEVVAFARRRRRWVPEGVRLVLGDVLDAESLGDAGRDCQRLYHLAALVTFDPRRREELLRVNGQGTANILAAARRWGVERCVVVSSAITLGLSRSPDAIMDEECVAREADARRNPYLASKLAAEQAAAVAAQEGQAVTIVNPTTVYGPGDRTLNSGTLVATIARSRLVPVPPGGANVVDVDDVAEGILAAGERGTAGRRYVLGGANLRFAEIFCIIAKVAGRRPRWLRLPRCARLPMAAAAWVAGRLRGNRFLTPQIVADLFAYKFYSSARAADELGWRATRSFRESVERAYAFYRREGLI